LLERLVRESLNNENVYVFGFALAVAARLELDIGGIVDRQAFLDRLSDADNRFALLKRLATFDYLSQPDDEALCLC
jgi:hypothetical protein